MSLSHQMNRTTPQVAVDFNARHRNGWLRVRADHLPDVAVGDLVVVYDPEDGTTCDGRLEDRNDRFGYLSFDITTVYNALNLLCTPIDIVVNEDAVYEEVAVVEYVEPEDELYGDGPCALCGRDPAAGYASVDEGAGRLWLCHDMRQRISCYVRWTVYDERPVTS